MIYENSQHHLDGAELYMLNSSPNLDFGYNIIKDDREPGGNIDTQILLNGYYAIPHSPIMARQNYWGNSQYFNGIDPFDRFGITVNYIPFLETPPVYSPLPQSIIIYDNENHAVDTVYAIEELIDQLEQLQQLLAIAEMNYLDRDYQTALDIYDEIISAFGDDLLAYTAYERLYIIERLQVSSFVELQVLQNLFSVQRNLTEDEQLIQMLDHFVSLLYIDMGEYLDAINRFFEIITEDPESEEAMIAEINLMTAAYLAQLKGIGLGKYSNEYLMQNGEYIEKLQRMLNKQYGLFSFEKIETIKPISYQLYQNYPNPFNPVTTIRYEIPERSKVELRVYDILGKEVMTIVNEYKDAGRFEASFNASKLSSGVYIYTIQAGEFISSKKMMLLK